MSDETTEQRHPIRRDGTTETLGTERDWTGRGWSGRDWTGRDQTGWTEQTSACRQTHTHSTQTCTCACHSIMPAALAFPAPSSTMQKGATDRHPHSRGAASYGHGGPWLHALPPCCKGTQVELEPNRRPEAWLQARPEPHHHRGRQNPPNPHALAPRLPVRATRNGPRAQSASAASTRAHTTRPVPPWPPGKRPWPSRGRLAEGVSPVLLGAIGRSMALQTREAPQKSAGSANIYRIGRARPPDVPAGKKQQHMRTRGVSVADTRHR